MTKKYLVTVMNGLKVKKITVILGDKSETYDVIQQIKREGHTGEIIGIEKYN